MIERDAFVIEHINARSLKGCLDEVKMLLKERCIDVLCVSETALFGYPSRFISIEGYKLFRCDIGSAGGTCMYVRNELTSSQIYFNIPACVGVEDTWVQIQYRKLPSIIVGVVYRHPKSPIETFTYLSDIFHQALLKNKALFILGDLNDDLLCPEAKLKQVIRASNLSQLIDKPTRVTENSKTLLDVIITNNKDMIISSGVIPFTYI